MSTFVYWHPSISGHDKIANHSVILANRLDHLYSQVSQMPGVQTREARPSEQADWNLAHTPEFVQTLVKSFPVEEGETHAFDELTVLNINSRNTLAYSCGAALQATEDIIEGRTLNGFCITYPGHNAGPASASGFCFVNNAVAAASRARDLGVSRVAIVDFDTHSGVGTLEAIRKGGRKELFLETYQKKQISACDHPAVSSMGNVARLECGNPLEFIKAWDQMLDQLNDFQPEFIVVSAGFDSHKDDPLGDMQLEDYHYVWLTERLVSIQPKMVATLEGGYNMEATSRCLQNFIAQMQQPF